MIKKKKRLIKKRSSRLRGNQPFNVVYGLNNFLSCQATTITTLPVLNSGEGDQCGSSITPMHLVFDYPIEGKDSRSVYVVCDDCKRKLEVGEPPLIFAELEL